MKFRVREGETLFNADRSVWAQSGEVVDLDIDAKDPKARMAAGVAIRGQQHKLQVEVAASRTSSGGDSGTSDRSMPPTEVRSGKATKRKAKKAGG